MSPKIMKMLKLEKKEKKLSRPGLEESDHVHAYTNFYFRTEEKMEDKEKELNHVNNHEMDHFDDKPKKLASTVLPELTASSLKSLPEDSKYSTVETWLDSLEEDPVDYEYTFENISDALYDTPYKANDKAVPFLTETQFLNIFILQDLPPHELHYANLPNKPSKPRPTKPINPYHTKPSNPQPTKPKPNSCIHEDGTGDSHYACVDVTNIHISERNRNRNLSKFAKSDQIIKSYSTLSSSPCSTPSPTASNISRPVSKHIHSRFTSVDSGLVSDISVGKHLHSRFNSLHSSNSSIYK